MKRGILIELPPGDGCEGCQLDTAVQKCVMQMPQGVRQDETGNWIHFGKQPGLSCLRFQAAYRAEVERVEKAEHDAKQCRFAVALAQEIIAKADAKAEKAEAEVVRLRAMVEAKEKAEAEVARLREAVRVRDERACSQHWMQAEGDERYLDCQYCGGHPGCCLDDCPTVTHPAEVTHG